MAIMLFDNNPIPSWVYNTKTKRIEDVNKAALKQYGYTRDEFLKMSVDELFINEKIDQIHSIPIEDEKGIKDAEIWRHRTKNNELIYVEVYNQILDSNDEIRLLLAHNITKHVKMQRELERTYLQLDFQLTNSPLAVIEWNHDFKVKKWSKKAEEIFGWKFQEVVNKKPNDFDFIYEDDLDQIRPLMKKLSNGELISKRMVNRNRTKNGEIKICEWHNSVLLDDDGSLISILSQVQDITQKDIYEKLILEQKRILQLIATGHELGEILKQIIFLIQKHTQGARCSIMINDNNGYLNLIAAPDLPEVLRKAINRIPISPKEGGVCGMAAYKKSEVIAENFNSDIILNQWEDAVNVAKKVNITACRSTPIISSEDDVLGTFAYYYSDPDYIKKESRDVIQTATDLAGIAIERAQTQKVLAESEAKFKTLFEYANDGIFIIDDDHFVDCNKRILEMLGCSKSDIIGKKPADFSPKRQFDGRLSSEKAREKINLALGGSRNFSLGQILN